MGGWGAKGVRQRLGVEVQWVASQPPARQPCAVQRRLSPTAVRVYGTACGSTAVVCAPPRAQYSSAAQVFSCARYSLLQLYSSNDRIVQLSAGRGGAAAIGYTAAHTHRAVRRAGFATLGYQYTVCTSRERESTHSRWWTERGQAGVTLISGAVLQLQLALVYRYTSS